MCDLKFRFMNIVVKWLGSINDFFILENSVLKDMFERGVIFEGWFFGDSGYFLWFWLFILVLNLIIRLEERYNVFYIRIRNIVECSFGVLKLRFRCFDISGGFFFYLFMKVCRVMVVVVVLYNMCINNGVFILVDCVDVCDRG